MAHRRGADRLMLASEEAAEWFLRLKDDRLALKEQREYLNWLKSSPDNIGEALRVGQVYSLLSKMKLSPLGDAPVSNIVDLEPRQGVRGEPAPAQRLHSRRPWALAATLAALTVGAALVVAQQLGAFERTVETGASEWRHFTLADGSKVSAGPRTRLKIEFDDTRRLIHQPRGEALFNVQKDPMRPFYVDAGWAVVRAVGTQFAVVRQDERVLVTVQEGLVAVSQAQPAQWLDSDGQSAMPESRAVDSIPVSAGERAAVSRAGGVTVEHVDVPTEIAWAHGRLIFDGKTVAQAAEEFNRRNRLQIRVRDAAVAERLVVGVFDAADPESFAQVVAREAPVVIVRDVPGVITLQSLEENLGVAATPSNAAVPMQSTQDRTPGAAN
jgi:transmembrane sensor